MKTTIRKTFSKMTARTAAILPAFLVAVPLAAQPDGFNDGIDRNFAQGAVLQDRAVEVTMTREVLHQVIDASPLDGSRVVVTFENGVCGTYDCAYLMEDPYWARLKMSAYFRQVKAECGTLVWPGDLDVAPESVWERCAKEQSA